MPIDLRDPVASRTLSSGRCYLYVAPCAFEDLLKLGFSRDPLQRFRSLHRRWFEFFDIERIALVETETVRDARALETRFKRDLADLNTTVPLTVVREAGGEGEWYRGATTHLDEAVRLLASRGYRVHVPARDWFRDRLLQQRELLYSWADAMLTVDELEGRAGPTLAQRSLRDALDAFAAFGIPLADSLPPAVLEWYRRTGGHGEPAARSF